MHLKTKIYLTMAAVCLSPQPHAQERAATGAVDTQMTWSALSAKVDGALATSNGVNSRVDQIVACNAKQMIYSPNTKGKDSGGCVAHADVADIIACGKDGKVFNGAKCIEPETSGGLRWVHQGEVGSTSPRSGNSEGATLRARGLAPSCKVASGTPCATKGQKCWYSMGFTVLNNSQDTQIDHYGVSTCL